VGPAGSGPTGAVKAGETPPQTGRRDGHDMFPKELKEASRFHTHLGPYLVVGLRMGRAVVERMGDRPFSYKIVAHTGRVPPYSCSVDGVQLATPCTTGNGCLKVADERLMAVDASDGGRTLRVRLRSEVYDKIESECSEDDQEQFSLWIWEMPEKELLVVTEGDADD
jgi:formylmethanofuran dehydrogenase subunit E